MVIGPAGEDSFLDAFAVGLADPGGIGAVSLVDWVCCSGAWVDPVVPGRTRNSGSPQGLTLGTGQSGECSDEVVFRSEEFLGSVVVEVSGPCTFSLCKSPIAFPRASLVPSSWRTRSRSACSSASCSACSLARACSKAERWLGVVFICP